VMETKKPPRWGRTQWALLAAVVMAGVAVGLGLFTFDYAEGLSYLSSDPKACINCHAMQTQWDGWNHSSHRNVATCNDCHTPHRFPDKWIVKGINGFNHSLAFTTGNYPNPIQIREFNSNIAEENCRTCHQDLTMMIRNLGTEGYTHTSFADAMHTQEEMSCVRCHGNVGHQSAARE